MAAAVERHDHLRVRKAVKLSRRAPARSHARRRSADARLPVVASKCTFRGVLPEARGEHVSASSHRHPSTWSIVIADLVVAPACGSPASAKS